jgi:hypothetical protein
MCKRGRYRYAKVGVEEFCNMGTRDAGRAKRPTPKRKARQYPTSKGSVGPRSKYDPSRPETWPKSFERKQEKMLYLFDVLRGMDNDEAPRNKALNELFEDRDRIGMSLNKEMMRTILDIQAMYKMGGFGAVPMVVAEKWASAYTMSQLPFDIDELGDPNPEIRGWTPGAVIRMALETFRLYLMGTCPMTRRVITKVRMLNDDTIGLEKLANVVFNAAEFEAMIDDELND